MMNTAIATRKDCIHSDFHNTPKYMSLRDVINEVMINKSKSVKKIII